MIQAILELIGLLTIITVGALIIIGMVLAITRKKE